MRTPCAPIEQLADALEHPVGAQILGPSTLGRPLQIGGYHPSRQHAHAKLAPVCGQLLVEVELGQVAGGAVCGEDALARPSSPEPALGHHLVGPEEVDILRVEDRARGKNVETPERLDLVGGDADRLGAVQGHQVDGRLVGAAPVEDQRRPVARDLIGVVDQMHVGAVGRHGGNAPGQGVGGQRGRRQEVQGCVAAAGREWRLEQTDVLEVSRGGRRSPARDQAPRSPERELELALDCPLLDVVGLVAGWKAGLAAELLLCAEVAR